jgi:hypothetical protein
MDHRENRAIPLGFNVATIPHHYSNSETVTKGVSHPVESRRRTDPEGRTMSLRMDQPTLTSSQNEEIIKVRVRDLVQDLQQMAATNLTWLEDLGDDPIVLTRDFYEVFLACRHARRAS